jgi:hypothetical protein
VVIVTPPSIPFNGEEMTHIDANNTSPDWRYSHIGLHDSGHRKPSIAHLATHIVAMQESQSPMVHTRSIGSEGHHHLHIGPPPHFHHGRSLSPGSIRMLPRQAYSAKNVRSRIHARVSTLVLPGRTMWGLRISPIGNVVKRWNVESSWVRNWEVEVDRIKNILQGCRA